MMPDGVFIEQQSFAEGTNCNRGSLLEPFSNTINKNEVNVEKEGKAKSCYYRFCSRLIPFGEYHPSYKTDGNGVQGISFRFLRRRNLKVKTVFFHKFFFWIVWLPSVRDGLWKNKESTFIWYQIKSDSYIAGYFFALVFYVTLVHLVVFGSVFPKSWAMNIKSCRSPILLNIYLKVFLWGLWEESM